MNTESISWNSDQSAEHDANRNPKHWGNPYNQHGELDTQQRSTFAHGYHGLELAMPVLKDKQQAALGEG